MTQTFRKFAEAHLREDVFEEFMKCDYDCDITRKKITYTEGMIPRLMADVIMGVLTWAKTPQGQDYWDKIYDSLLRGKSTYLRKGTAGPTSKLDNNHLLLL